METPCELERKILALRYGSNMAFSHYKSEKAQQIKVGEVTRDDQQTSFVLEIVE
jgi:hypothetical protein